MDTNTVLIIVAVVFVILIPIVPQMIRMRIWILRKLRLRWFAELHEKHFRGFTIAVRIIFAVFALLLLTQGIWDIL